MRRWYLAATLVWACSSQSATQAARPPSTTVPSPSVQPATAVHAHVTDYVVSPGLRWLMVFSPSELLSRLKTSQVNVLAPDRVSAFERSVGLQVSSVPEAAIAGFDYSTMYVVRTRAEHASQLLEALVRYRRRLSQPPVTQQVFDLTLYSGVNSGLPQHFVQLDGLTAAWSEGDPTPIKAAALLAQKRFTSIQDALNGPSLSLLPARCRSGEIVLYFPGPLDNRELAGAAGNSAVLSLVLAASLSLRVERDVVRLSGCVKGAWQSDGRERVGMVLDHVMAHRFTSLLGLSEDQKNATIGQTGDVVEFEFQWPMQPLVTRLEALLELRLSSLLGPGTSE